MHFEMINSLSDFFVRRTARLYFDIGSVSQFMKVILQDFSSYLGWSQKRIEQEKIIMKELLQDATQYYDQEF
jgi:glycerol-3-phosphate dehydrogenase